MIKWSDGNFSSENFQINLSIELSHHCGHSGERWNCDFFFSIPADFEFICHKIAIVRVCVYNFIIFIKVIDVVAVFSVKTLARRSHTHTHSYIRFRCVVSYDRIVISVYIIITYIRWYNIPVWAYGFWIITNKFLYVCMYTGYRYTQYLIECNCYTIYILWCSCTISEAYLVTFDFFSLSLSLSLFFFISFSLPKFMCVTASNREIPFIRCPWAFVIEFDWISSEDLLNRQHNMIHRSIAKH